MGQRFDGMGTAKVSRFLLCSRNTATQATRDISEILDRFSKARTREKSSHDQIESFVRVGNQRKGLRALNPVILTEIQSLFSFLSNRTDKAR
jgi:hypothetical protein